MEKFRRIFLLIIFSVLQYSLLTSANPLPKDIPKDIDFRQLTQEEVDAKDYLERLDPEYSNEKAEERAAWWAYTTNVSNATLSAYEIAEKNFKSYQNRLQSHVLLNFNNSDNYVDVRYKKGIQYLRINGKNDMPPADYDTMVSMEHEMKRSYDAIKICEYPGSTSCEKVLDYEGVQEKLRTVINPTQLNYYYFAWQNAASETITATAYKDYVDLQNTLAVANGFPTRADMLLSEYNNGNDDWSPQVFQNQMFAEWDKVLPNFQTLQKHINQVLKNSGVYGSSISSDGIPPYLMGSTSGEGLSRWEQEAKPNPREDFEGKVSLAIARQMTTSDMFYAANELLVSMGFPQVVTDDFFIHSIIENPPGRNNIICTPEAIDFYNEIFGVRMCTQKTMEDLGMVYQQVLKVQYFNQYKSGLPVLRKAAIPAMMDAMATVLESEIRKPKYLQCTLGLDIGYLCPTSPTTTTATTTTTTPTTTITTTTSTNPSTPITEVSTTTSDATTQTDATTQSDATTVDATTVDDTTVDATTIEATTVDATTVDATTVDATTVDATTVDATTVDATTVDATTVDATTVDATTVDATTVDATTVDATTVDATTVEATTVDATTVDATTVDATTVDATTVDATTVDATTVDATTVEATTVDATTVDATTVDATTVDATTVDATTVEATTVDATTVDATTVDATTVDATTVDATTVDATTVEATTVDATTVDATTVDATTDEATTVDATTVDATTVDATTVDATTVDATTVDVTTIDATTVEATTVDATTVDTTTVDATTVDATTVDATTVEATTVDATTVDATTVDATTVDATTVDATTVDATTVDATTVDATTVDATTVDATTVDATTVDATTVDATTVDATTVDATTVDATTVDATTVDATTVDATTVDATTVDATTVDATTVDATTVDATTVDATTVDATTVDATTVDAITVDATTVDATTVDATTVDATTVDATTVDATTVDATTVDATTVDATTVDATTVDATTVDATTVDATTVDATTVDATTVDATTVDATTVDATTVDATTVDGSAGDFQQLLDNGKDSFDLLVKTNDPRKRLLDDNDLNLLFKQQLKYSSIAFAMAAERWRSQVYRNEIIADNYNTRWWELRKQYEGVEIPANRQGYFDPAATYGILSNTPYIDRFVSHMLQFQILENLCTIAGQFRRDDSNSKALYECDLSHSTAAGDMMKRIMEVGAGIKYQDAIQITTNRTEISADSLVEYFKPIVDLIGGGNGDPGPSDSSKSAAGGIIAGVIIGCAVIAIVIGYFVGRKLTQNKQHNL